ncbi:hypothetical protein TNCV_192011 [Trichonephila clavipes]|nr:hypothetical protein TNCV_192011 [Trichonephila clavipes]
MVHQHILLLLCQLLPFYTSWELDWTWWTCCFVSALPDLNPLDFFWRSPKIACVCETPVTTEEGLTTWIVVASADIASTPDSFESVRWCRLYFVLRSRITCHSISDVVPVA